MSGTTLNAFLFLLTSVFDIYLFVLIIRLVLAFSGGHYEHPITQLIVKLTSFIIDPLRRFLPDVKGIETSTIVVILLVEFIKFFLISCITFGFPNLLGVIILSFADAFKLLLQAFFYGIILQAIISFIQPQAPVLFILNKFTAPILRPFQRFIPPVSGFDISPIPALIVLQLLIIIVVNPLLAKGLAIAVG